MRMEEERKKEVGGGETTVKEGKLNKLKTKLFGH